VGHRPDPAGGRRRIAGWPGKRLTAAEQVARLALRAEVSPLDLLALPASVYDEYLAAVLEQDRLREEAEADRVLHEEQERLKAELQARMGR
jgi:hypothetical protein